MLALCQKILYGLFYLFDYLLDTDPIPSDYQPRLCSLFGYSDVFEFTPIFVVFLSLYARSITWLMVISQTPTPISQPVLLNYSRIIIKI